MLDTPETNSDLKYEWRKLARPLIEDLAEAGESEFLYNYAMQMLEKCGLEHRKRAVNYATLLANMDPEDILG